jgi:hypothetical protein
VQVVEAGAGKWGYVDKKGNLVIPARFESARRFSDGVGA